MSCWNCQSEARGEAFCPSCGRIQPLPPGQSLFQAFGLEPAVEVPLASLERQFRDLSLKLHPDRFAQKDARERRYSLERTTALNEAYKTLKDPFRRAFYLLRLLGTDLTREEAGPQGAMPLPFLEEVMELRERLEVLKAKGDLAGARAMAEEARRRQEASLKEGQGALARRLAAPDNAPALEDATLALSRVRYFMRFLEEVERMEEELSG